MRDPYESLTVLSLGMRGVLGLEDSPASGATFELVGRTCVRGRRSSIWNEWSLRLLDGQHEAPMFLAEGNGLFTLYEEGELAVRFDRLAPGRGLDVGFVVVDRADATRVAVWGEGEANDVGTTYAYADLSSTRDGRPATIDVGSGKLFIGRRVDLKTLGLDRSVASARVVDAVHLIAAPEVSRPKGVDVWLEIGLEGVLEPQRGGRHRVVGMLSRSSEDGKNRWDEYCLQSLERGTLTWISVSDDGHWGIAEPVEAGLVIEQDTDVVLIGDDRYSILSPPSQARIEWAAGRFPWAVQIGDTVHTKELLSGRYILTKEWTDDELTWTRAKYVEPDTIAKTFNKRSLPKPRGRAPNQG